MKTHCRNPVQSLHSLQWDPKSLTAAMGHDNIKGSSHLLLHISDK